MTIDICYFSGTGNCLAVARRLAERTGGRLVAIPDALAAERVRTSAQTVGIVFPTYLAALHGVPLMVETFVERLDDLAAKRMFAVCTCGGHEIVNAVPALWSLARVVRDAGGRLAAEYTVRLPMNNLDYAHIPVPIETDEATIVHDAERQVDDIAARVLKGRRGRLHLARRLVTFALTPMYAMMAKACMKALRELALEPGDSTLGFRELMPLTDRSIRVDDACTGCGTCARVCPARNIEMSEGRPNWLHRCEMCFACDEWCPRDAVHHWGRPDGAKYHHPAVKARDLFRRSGADPTA